MVLFRTVCMAAVLSLGSTAAWAAPEDPSGVEDEEIKEHITDPILPGIDAFKSGALWGVFGAAFMGTWGGLIMGSFVAAVAIVWGLVAGLGEGFILGLVVGANVGGIGVGLVLGAFGAVFGAVFGVVVGMVAAVIAALAGALYSALAGSLWFGVMGVVIHVAQQWLARVPFGLLRDVDRGRAKARRRDIDDTPPPVSMPPPYTGGPVAPAPTPSRPLLPGN